MGTGFLVARMNEDGVAGKVLLVTNKHVIGRDPDARERVQGIICSFNTRPGMGPRTLDVTVPVRLGDGACLIREHPDPDTDVCAVDLSNTVAQMPQIDAKWVQYDLFGDAAKRAELDITVGDDLITLGFPLGLRQGSSTLPLARQGMLSTRIGELLHDRVRGPDGSLRERHMRAFLIDGATVPGSSGSPVLLRPVIGRQVRQVIQLGTALPVLLGIIAETRYAPMDLDEGLAQGFAGLGMAFDVETIRDTVELFFG